MRGQLPAPSRSISAVVGLATSEVLRAWCVRWHGAATGWGVLGVFCQDSLAGNTNTPSAWVVARVSGYSWGWQRTSPRGHVPVLLAMLFSLRQVSFLFNGVPVGAFSAGRR